MQTNTLPNVPGITTTPGAASLPDGYRVDWETVPGDSTLRASLWGPIRDGYRPLMGRAVKPMDRPWAAYQYRGASAGCVVASAMPDDLPDAESVEWWLWRQVA